MFVMTEKVTHYIQAVDLGAAKYSLSISKKSKYSEEVGLEATVEKVCSGKAKAERGGGEFEQDKRRPGN